MRSAALLVWLGLALFASVALGAEHAQPVEIRPVRTVVATPHAEGEPVSLTGHIRARTEESLAFRIEGRMMARRVDVGQIVKKGELVAELDPRPQEDLLRNAQAQLATAEAALQEATNNLERQKVLVGQGWSTRVQFDAAQKTYLTAQAQVKANAAVVHNAQDQLGYTKLLADAPGAVISKGAEAGEVVKAGQMIVSVALDDGVDAVFDVPATLLRQVSPDQEIHVSLTDDPKIRAVGRVRELAPQADSVTRTYRAKIALTNVPAAMRLGATVTGQANMVAPRGIELPGTALTTMDNKPAVWVVDPQSDQVSLRPVQVERQDSPDIVVTHGLQGGERVVTAGVHALRPGQKVRLLEKSQ